MTEHRKDAYRFLLYWAMLEIRMLQWIGNRPFRLLNPLSFRAELRRVRRAGAIADWLHNLAQFSAIGFDRFDEAAFWKQYDFVVRQYGANTDYRIVFDRALVEVGRPAGAA